MKSAIAIQSDPEVTILELTMSPEVTIFLLLTKFSNSKMLRNYDIYIWGGMIRSYDIF